MSTKNTALDRLRNRCAEVWDTLSGMTLSQIVEQNFKLSPETEGDPGSYDIVNNPYWRKVIDACYHPEVRRVVILKSTQVGGTILTQGIILGFAVIDPAPTMYVTPTKDEFKIQRDRLFANALASDTPYSRLVPKKNRWNMEVLQLGAQKVNVAFAGSAQRLRGKPCKRVFKNETDVYIFKGDVGNPHKAADERVKQFQYDYLIVDESTPVGDESHIFGAYEKTNKERFYCQCPHCQHWQELRFFVLQSGTFAGCGGVSGYRTPPTTANGRDKGGLLEPAEARKKAFYICEKGCRIEPQFKNSMIRGGMWVPKGMRIGKLKRSVDLTKIAVEKRYDYSPCGNYKLQGEPLFSRERSGFHVWTMMQSKITIGDLAAAYIEHQNDGKQRDFYQNWLGWRFRIGQKVPAWPDIARKYTRSYMAGTVPDKVWFLTAAVDVQEDLIYWMVMGWAPMRTPYLIGFGEVFQSTTQGGAEDEEGIVLASDLQTIPDLLLTPRWPVNGINPRGKKVLPVRKCGVDSNYRTMDVHDLVRFVANEERFCCIRGDDSVGSQNIRRSVISANSRSGLQYEGGLVQYQLNRTYYQDQLAARLLAAPNQDGALHLPSDILPAGKKLLRQLANVKKNDKGFYQMIDGTLGKDYRDLAGYNEGMADLVVGEMGWTEKAWRDDLREQIHKSKSKAATEAKRRNGEIDRD